MAYNVVEVDLSEGAVSDKKLELGAVYKRLVVMRSPGEVRVSDIQGAPKIPLTHVGQRWQWTCSGRGLDAIYYSHDGGTGVVELLVSDDETDVSFGGADSAAAGGYQKQVLCRFQPAATPAVSTGGAVDSDFFTDPRLFTTDARNEWVTDKANDAGSVPHLDSTTRTFAWRLFTGGAASGFPAQGRIRHNNIHFNQLYSLLNTPQGVTYRRGRNWFWEIETSARVDRTIVSAASNPCFALVGFGDMNLAVGPTLEGNGLWFYASRDLTNWRALIYDRANGEVLNTELAGFPVLEGQHLCLRVGVWDEVPSARWLVNGEEAHREDFPVAVHFMNPASTVHSLLPLAGCFRTNNADAMGLRIATDFPGLQVAEYVQEIAA